jgi:hypothetical protein
VRSELADPIINLFPRVPALWSCRAGACGSSDGHSLAEPPYLAYRHTQALTRLLDASLVNPNGDQRHGRVV